MKGKMRSFFEDTGIILVLSSVVIGGYYGYSAFTKESKILPNTNKSDEHLLIVKEKPIVDVNKSIIINEVMTPIIVKKIEVKQEKLTKIIEKKVLKKEILKVPTPLIEEIEVKKEKNVDLVILRTFLRNIKFSMASNIVKRDDINESISQELKIRVTVLKDGSYEELIFVDGDKKLFEINKENILRVFPINIDDKIKDDFPRYVRISIK